MKKIRCLQYSIQYSTWQAWVVSRDTTSDCCWYFITRNSESWRSGNVVCSHKSPHIVTLIGSFTFRCPPSAKNSLNDSSSQVASRMRRWLADMVPSSHAASFCSKSMRNFSRMRFSISLPRPKFTGCLLILYAWLRFESRQVVFSRYLSYESSYNGTRTSEHMKRSYTTCQGYWNARNYFNQASKTTRWRINLTAWKDCFLWQRHNFLLSYVYNARVLTIEQDSRHP